MSPSSRSTQIKVKRLFLGLGVVALLGAGLYWSFRTRPPGPLVAVMTLGGLGPRIHTDAANGAEGLSDPFGVVVDGAGTIFVSDGIGGRVFRLSANGQTEVVVSGLSMPSALALAGDGSLIVANTGAHTIIRIDPTNATMKLVAGSPGTSGDSDGFGAEARFNGPVGVATGADGLIVVADTYNDRIRVISSDGHVKTVAGAKEPGFRDGRGDEARFDTPCGVVVGSDGSILVADTGNHRIRRVGQNGEVSTLAGRGDAGSRDGTLTEAAFDQPVAIALRRDGALLVADAGGSRVRMILFGETTSVATVAGGYPTGLIDGTVDRARFNRPAGLAFTPDDLLVVADGGNGFVRGIIPRGLEGVGRAAKPEEAIVSAKEIRATVGARWPFNPPEARREIAGTFGEIRGEAQPERDAWFHSGLDIPGGYGETVRALFSEQVTLPLAVEGAGGPRERLRLPLFGYIHLRIGRDANDRPLPGFEEKGFRLRHDEQGLLSGLRIRRGARFNAGDALGSLNRLNHVHLVAGPPGAEVNALAALTLPGLKDTMSPVIEGVTLTGENGEPLKKETERGGQSRIVVTGATRIIVRTYDQVDGNAAYRKLAPFRLAYQILNVSGAPARGFESPRETIIFERLPTELSAVSIAYAEGSQAGYEGQTIFAFLVTNRVRDGEVQMGFWQASELEPGRYTLRVFVADFFGNQSQSDLPVRIAG